MDDAAARQRATDVVAFLRGDVAQLLSHGLVKDFFADALWDRLPSSWHTPIDELAADFGALAALLHRPDVGDAASWPLSLRAFVAAAHALRLPGQLDARGEAPAEGGAGAAAPRARADAYGRCAEQRHVATALRSSIKPKKMHEIVRLSELSDRVASEAGCDVIVDVGSGQGYLSRALAFERNWAVVAIEMAADNVREAARIDGKVERQLRKQLEAGRWQPGVGSLRHVAATLPPDISEEAFLRTCGLLLDPDDGDEDGTAGEGAEGVGGVGRHGCRGATALVGLHTCGDLAPTCLRVFDSAGGAVRALVNVGCCYHHVTAEGDEGDGSEEGEGAGGDDGEEGESGGAPALSCAPCEAPANYPMSAFVGSLGLRASFHVREMACHSASAYAERLERAAADEAAGAALRAFCAGAGEEGARLLAEVSEDAGVS